MAYLFGILFATLAFFSAIQHLQQTVGHYYDQVALVMVVGGTISVAVITFPWQYRSEILYALRVLFLQPRNTTREVLREAIQFVSGNNNGTVPGLPGLILRDGAELLSLGFSADKVQEILETRISESFERMHKVANAIRSLSKYPPAFGLMGTVLGLVSLMRAVSAGMEARQTGVQMAIALTATLYGLVVANLFVAPAGELILKNILDDKKRAEIALRAVMLRVARANPLEAQELLNSYANESARVNVIDLNAPRSAA